MSAAAAEIPRPPAGRSLLILGVAGLAFALAQTTLIPAFPELVRALHSDPGAVAWTLTGYLVAAAVFTPVMGRLGDMFGKRRMLVVSLGFFGAGSVISALGDTIEVVVAGRLLQGVGGGIFPLCFGIIRDEFPEDRVSKSIGLMSAVAGIGGGLGLILGGVIVDNFSYHLIFWLGGVMAVVAGVAAQLLIPESPRRSPGSVDVRGAAVLAVGLTLPLVAISRANEWGWGSGRFLGMVATGLVVLAGWVALERRTEHPLADIRSLASPPVLMTNIATLLVGFGMFGSFVLTPQLAQAATSTGYGFGLDATGAGLLMLPGALVMLVVGPVSGALGARVGNKVPLTLGALITSGGLLLLSHDHSTQLAVLVLNLVMSCGIAFAFAAMPNLIMEAVPIAQTGEATGFNALVRSVGSSLGTQLTATVLAGSIAAGSTLPTDHGYTDAYLVGAGGAIVAAMAAAAIPRVRSRHAAVGALEEVGAAGPHG
jgi:EmrB/QacA subfamily drug resistance transporter